MLELWEDYTKKTNIDDVNISPELIQELFNILKNRGKKYLIMRREKLIWIMLRKKMQT